MNRTRDRVASVAFAVLLQMGFVAIFIYSLPLIAPPKKLAREITFFLPRPRDVPKSDAAPRGRRSSPSPSPSPFLALPDVPRLELSPLAMPPPATDLQAFGKSLFGCAPENLNNLMPEQRAHCSGFGSAPHDATGMAEPPSLVKDLPRRQAELAARNTPARVPCTSVETQDIGPLAQVTTGFVDPLCLLNGYLNGFGGLPP